MKRLQTPQRATTRRSNDQQSQSTAVPSNLFSSPASSRTPARRVNEPAPNIITDQIEYLEKVLAATKKNLMACGEELAEVGFDESLPPVEEAVKKVFRMTSQLEKQRTILREAEATVRTSHLTRNPGNANDEDVMGQFVDRMTQVSSEAPRVAWTKNTEFSEFHQNVWEILQEGQSASVEIPQLEDDVGCERGPANDEDDLVVMSTNSTVSLICPITRVQLVNPVMNPTCKHTYSKAAIEQIIRGENSCPVPGCNRAVALTRLVKNEAVERKLARMNNRLFPIRS